VPASVPGTTAAGGGDLIVRGRHVVCRVRPDGTPAIVDDGGVLVRDGAVVEVADFDVLARAHPRATVIGDGGDVVFPGLVNAHHHTGLTPIQHGIRDMPLELWLPSFMGMRAVDPYLDTVHSALEMLESGVTTVQHIHGGPIGPRAGWMPTAERIVQAYEDVGLRVSYCFMLRDRNRVVYGDDDAFLASLPPALAAELRAVLAGRTAPLEGYVEFFEELAGRWSDPAGRVRVQLAPANLHWCTDRALALQRDAAARHHVGLHMHLLETAYQRAFAERQHAASAVRHLHDLGLLGPSMTIGHGIWMTSEDIDLVASTGTRVCHNASSGLRLQSGVAPVAELLDRGVTVALGIDQAGINDDRDMLQEMRVASCLQRRPGHEHRPPSAATVFRMATEFGAATTGFADRIGALEPGRAADLVLIDWRAVGGPYLDADTPVLEALLHRGKASAVHTSMVDGRVVLRGGCAVGVDAAAVRAEIARQLASGPTDAERRRRDLARLLMPHVRDFYRGWAVPGQGGRELGRGEARS
jgi:5-methylthioadenosine/S-adenosylhomocysteine deaminase